MADDLACEFANNADKLINFLLFNRTRGHVVLFSIAIIIIIEINKNVIYPNQSVTLNSRFRKLYCHCLKKFTDLLTFMEVRPEVQTRTLPLPVQYFYLFSRRGRTVSIKGPWEVACRGLRWNPSARGRVPCVKFNFADDQISRALFSRHWKIENFYVPLYWRIML